MCIKRMSLLVVSLLFGLISASSQVNDLNQRIRSDSDMESIVKVNNENALPEKTNNENSVGEKENNENAPVTDAENNPTTKKIVYCCVEGPEVSTLIRDKGVLKNGKAVIELPDHYSMVTSEKGLTAQVTPAGNCKGLFISELSTQKMVIEELGNGDSNVEFYYLVQGVKKGYENYTVFRTSAKKVGPDCR